jgi:hypothetical protein
MKRSHLYSRGGNPEFFPRRREPVQNPAAISYRIKMLEESLGTPLFLRTTRSVSLTPPALICLSAACSG